MLKLYQWCKPLFTFTQNLFFALTALCYCSHEVVYGQFHWEQ